MKPRALLQYPILATVAATVAFAAEVVPEKYQLYFWKGPAYRQDDRVLAIEEHPCGEVVVAEVTRIPSSDDPVLEPSEMREVDSNGATVRRWLVPADAYTVAVRSERVLFWVGGHTKLWVDPNGTISMVSSGDPQPSAGAECPFAVEGIEEWQSCLVFYDLADSKPRYIISSDVCT